MTHEIMNSVAPISSLADTLMNRLKVESGRLQTEGDDIEVGIRTIKRRSEGLLKFAETYRNLNKVTQPNVKPIVVIEMFDNLHTLMEPTLANKNIELDIVLIDPGMVIEADVNLIEQVMINLLAKTAQCDDA